MGAVDFLFLLQRRGILLLKAYSGKSMTQADLMELARQGEGGAIATLIQQAVQPGIGVKAHLREDCLHILLEAEIAPE